MLLTKNDMTAFHIPQRSKCTIATIGEIKDGDMVEIISPIFSSINFVKKEINTSSFLTVRVEMEGADSNRVISSDGNNIEGTLVCEDNDVFGMYVEIS